MISQRASSKSRRENSCQPTPTRDFLDDRHRTAKHRGTKPWVRFLAGPGLHAQKSDIMAGLKIDPDTNVENA